MIQINGNKKKIQYKVTSRISLTLSLIYLQKDGNSTPLAICQFKNFIRLALACEKHTLS